MRYFFFFLGFLLLGACTETTTTAPPQQQPNTEISATPKSRTLPTNANHITQNAIKQTKCVIDGEVLEENELWLKDQARLICILADSSTYDPNFGMSHRILEVYNTYTCSLDLKLKLPVNLSPDYPYFLADINYNNDSKIVAIKAAKTIYCLDLSTKKMLPLLTPVFKGNRADVDASTGNIIRLELWENFLIGYAQDRGTFVFDLTPPNGPKPILPFAEYKLAESSFNALFLLSSGNNNYQAILPSYDWEEETFAINPIYKSPIPLNTDVQKSALDNQFLVLRQAQNKNALLIDMKARAHKSLPAELIGKSTKEILAWAKG